MTAPATSTLLPQASPVQPVELSLDSVFQFRCHKDIACFNACCRNTDLQLTPYDILRLKNRVGLTSSESVARYTAPFEMDADGMPGIEMGTEPGTSECVCLTEEGCGAYEDRPAACRYYALGNMAVRKKGPSEIKDAYFVVREKHCLGHEEPHQQRVAEYRVEQELAGDEENLHKFPMRFLEQVLFGAGSLEVRPGDREKRIAERQGIWNRRCQKQVLIHQEDLQRQQYGE